MTVERVLRRIRCPQCGMVGRGSAARLQRPTVCPKCGVEVVFVEATATPASTARRPGVRPSARRPRSALAGRHRRHTRRWLVAALLVLLVAAVATWVWLTRWPRELDTRPRLSSLPASVVAERRVLIRSRDPLAGGWSYRLSPEPDSAEIGRAQATLAWRWVAVEPLPASRQPYRFQVRCAWTLTVDNPLDQPISAHMTSVSKVLRDDWTDRWRGREYRRALASFASFVVVDRPANLVVPARSRASQRGEFAFAAPDLRAVHRISGLTANLVLTSDQPVADLLLDGATLQPLR